MIAEQLKKAILQTAIQGKLTEQRPEDGDAWDLLKEIRQEKARLVKEGKIKQGKPLPEINEDEIPFDIPDNWCWVRLENITSTLGDGIHGTPNYDDLGKYKFINGNNLFDGTVVFKNDTKNIDESEYIKYKKPLNDTTVLVSINGTIGNIAFFNNERIILGKSACYFNLLGNITKEYIKFLISSDYFLKYAYDKATGSTIKNVSLQAMRNFLIPLPPLAEQQRVVSQLDEILLMIGRLKTDESKLDVLQKSFPKQIRDSILQAAVQGKLTEQLPSDGDAQDLLKDIQKEKERLIEEGKIKKDKPLPEITEDEIPFDIPFNWCWVRLGNLVSIISGTSYTKSDLSKSGIRILRGGNIIDRTNQIVFFDNDVFVNSKFQNEEKQILRDDVLIVGSTGSNTVIGKPAFATSDLPGTQIGAFLRIIRLINKNYANYVHIIFKSDYYRKHITNSIQGTNIYNIRSIFITEMVIPLPPIAEQDRIVARLNELLPLCNSLE